MKEFVFQEARRFLRIWLTIFVCFIGVIVMAACVYVLGHLFPFYLLLMLGWPGWLELGWWVILAITGLAFLSWFFD